MEHARLTQNIVRSTAAIAACLGLAAINSDIGTTPSESMVSQSGFTCNEGLIARSQTSLDRIPISTIQSGILGIKMFEDSTDQVNYSERDDVALLNAHGIKLVDTRVRTNDQQTDSLDYSAYSSELADTPASVVRASGLKRIVILPRPDYTNTKIGSTEEKQQNEAFINPPHTTDTLWLTESVQLSNGLAAMVLDNYCAGQKAQILQTFEHYTQAAGAQYNTVDVGNFWIPDSKYPNTQTFDEARWDQQYENIFTDVNNTTSARDDFLNLMNDAIMGFGWHDTRVPADSARGRKAAMVRAIFDSIERDGDAWLVWDDFIGYVGNHHLSLAGQVYRYNCLAAELSGKSKAEQNHIFDSDAALIGFGEGPVDPSLPNCDNPLTNFPGKNLFVPAEQVTTFDFSQ